MNQSLFIIPFYNEEKRIPHSEFIDGFARYHDIDFLLVNDGSVDKTQEILNDFASKFANVSVLNLEKNSGKAEAIRKAILEFSKANPNLQIVMGTRIKLLGNSVVRSSKRHYFGRIFATIISNFILETAVYDTQCGAKIIKSEVAVSLFEKEFRTKWLFDVEMLLRLKKRAGKLEGIVAEIPLTTWIEKGNTKIKLKEFISFPVQLIMIYFRDAE